MVSRDGAAWLPRCLAGLSRQTHPRLGILAVDDGSSDGSADLLAQALGPERLIRRSHNLGFAASVGEALLTEQAQAADYVLILHDDTVLEPKAVASMVDAAERLEGVGIVGPKVLDWERPDLLRDIGMTTDRFGYPYSPLEDDEIDQGQYDRIREVLSVSSCAMLVSRQAWSRIGRPDERLDSGREDVDFCWRARIAGFRVLMNPAAVARHRGASLRGERPGSDTDHDRFRMERAALAGMLKNYGLVSLVWLLPLHLGQSILRTLVLVLARRFQDAGQMVAAWAWNVAHVPGTIRRRVRVQAIRAVPDRLVRRSMAPAGIRIRRWTSAAAQALLPSRQEQGEGEPPVAARTRVLRVARDHPVATAWMVGVVLAAMAFRHLLGASPLVGGGLGTGPASASGFFDELLSGLRHTGLGGSAAASPALGLLGAGSFVALGSPALLQKVLLLGLPAVAGAACYRAVRVDVDETLPAVVAGAAYALSGVVLWAVSDGRIPALVFLAGLPWLATKLSLPFSPRFRVAPHRWIAGAAMGVAVIGSFYPGAVLAGAVVVLGLVLTPVAGIRRGRGPLLALAAVVVAALLLFPLTLDLIRGGGSALGEPIRHRSFWDLVRLSPGRGPGAWPTGLFLPIAAALGLVFVRGRPGPVAVRAAIGSIASVYLAWFAAAGYLPRALDDPVAYVGVAAFSFATLVGLGLAALLRGVSRAEFGHRQLSTAAMAAVLVVGLGGQMAQAANGGWRVGGPERVPPAYPVVGTAGGPPYRVLWLGRANGGAFPAPGGVPDGVVEAGPASVRFAVRDPAGASSLDVGRPADGPGYTVLRRMLGDILVGETRHGGALLASFGLRFVIAVGSDLPTPAQRRLARQVDLDLIPAEGMTIFRNAKAAPVAAGIAGEAWARAAASPAREAAASLPPPSFVPLRPDRSGQSFVLSSGPAAKLVLLSQQFDRRWSLVPSDGRPVGPVRAFGWAVGFRGSPLEAGSVIRFGGQGVRTAEVGAMALLWMAALWMTRRTDRRG